MPGHVPSLHLCPACPCTRAEPALPRSPLSGCGGCCLSAPKTPKCKPSAVNPSNPCFVRPQPLPVSARREMVKPPWGGGALQSLCSITWQGNSAKRRGARVERQEELLCPSAGQQHTLLLLVCSTSIPCLCVLIREISLFF